MKLVDLFELGVKIVEGDILKDSQGNVRVVCDSDYNTHMANRWGIIQEKYPNTELIHAQWRRTDLTGNIRKPSGIEKLQPELLIDIQNKCPYSDVFTEEYSVRVDTVDWVGVISWRPSVVTGSKQPKSRTEVILKKVEEWLSDEYSIMVSDNKVAAYATDLPERGQQLLWYIYQENGKLSKIKEELELRSVLAEKLKSVSAEQLREINKILGK